MQSEQELDKLRLELRTKTGLFNSSESESQRLCAEIKRYEDQYSDTKKHQITLEILNLKLTQASQR